MSRSERPGAESDGMFAEGRRPWITPKVIVAKMETTNKSVYSVADFSSVTPGFTFHYGPSA